jgi:hydrogenase maturation protease
LNEKTLVLALGNPLRGDDGVGTTVIEHLQEQSAELPPEVTLIDGGTPGLETILLMQDYERVIIVDAAEMDLPPGIWRRFSTDAVRMQARDLHLRGTLHYAGLAEALALGEAMQMLPPQITIFGVQPARMDWELGLSDAVSAAVPAVAAAIKEMLHGEDTYC